MRRYNLKRDDTSKWQIVDSLTMRLAEVEGTPMSGMLWSEACEMVTLMNSLDGIQRASARHEALDAAE